MTSSTHAPATLLDLLTTPLAGDACTIAVVPPAAPGATSATAAMPGAPAGAGLLRRLAAPLMLAARPVLRRPQVRRLALRILKRSPTLYARAYRMMMASGSAAPAASAQPDPDHVATLSPRANAILRRLRRLQATAPRPNGARPRLAFVSPLPPERTGIATYAIELLAELKDHLEIELVVAQPEVTLPPALADLPVRQAAWFAEHGGEYDQVLYQFGNSPFHSHMFSLLARFPGVVVLHDFFLGGALVHAQMSGADPRAWGDALLYSHGYAAVRASQSGEGRGQAHKDWPASLPVLENATRVIVHSQHARQLAADWFGAAITRKIDVIPHPRTPPSTVDRAAARISARTALGIKEDTFLVCSFGFVAPNKLTHELLRAWIGSNLHADRDCALVLAGANHDSPYGVEVEALIRGAGPNANIHIPGWLDAETYRQYLQAADVGVQLRTNAHGESSGAVLDCMNVGLPTIVNANGSMAEFPPDAVWRLPDAFEIGELGAALETLRGDPALRRAFGMRAVAHLDAGMRPARCAALYRATLEHARADGDTERQAWQAAMAAARPRDELALQRLAQQLADTAGQPGRRQLLVDVSDWADEGTPDMPVQSQLLELMEQSVRSGVRVEPVRLGGSGDGLRYRYARNAAGRLLGLGWPPQDEPPVDIARGDVFYAPDARSPALQAAMRAGLLAAWRAHGVVVNACVRALPASDSDALLTLKEIGSQADRLLCTSEALARQLAALCRAPDLTRP
jgi:glycosyltransferase involved in cell wall biosynthesis